MKIICIGMNYPDHIRELNKTVPEEPVFFMKPDSALLMGNQPFFLPDFSNDVHYEVEIVVKINRLGKNIEERFADRYYNEITTGIDFTARDIQKICMQKGYPWEIAKAFDGSAVLGEFIKLDKLADPSSVRFHLLKNGTLAQQGNTKEMIFGIDRIIEYVSRFVTLKIGDLIFTGTPKGVGPVAINDRLEAFIEDKKILNFLIK